MFHLLWFQNRTPTFDGAKKINLTVGNENEFICCNVLLVYTIDLVIRYFISSGVIYLCILFLLLFCVAFRVILCLDDSDRLYYLRGEQAASHGRGNWLCILHFFFFFKGCVAVHLNSSQPPSNMTT